MSISLGLKILMFKDTYSSEENTKQNEKYAFLLSESSEKQGSTM
jgi:hypothetical protein